MAEREPRGKRLFLAVDIDDPVREAIARLTTDLRQRMDPHFKIAWVRPDRMHLTLHFFSDADAAMEDRIRRALSTPLPQAPFNMSLRKLGLFPSSGAPRVLWLGIQEGFTELCRLNEALHVVAGAPNQAAPRFVPHLTLGRFKNRVARGPLEEILRISAAAGSCRIDRVTLYESRLSPAGPTYLRLAEALLTA